MVNDLLKGKRGIVFGVANKRSIAYACARSAAQQGAELIITYQGERLREGAEDLAAALPGSARAMPCDVSSEAAIDTAFASLADAMPRVDFAVHSIAFAPREELEGDFVDTTRDGFRQAHEISAYSLTSLARRLAPLMSEGGSIVTMTYLGGERVVPHYNVMGVAKASLEASVRYLAADLGPKAIRVNAVSAGPIRTLAASGIGSFSDILEIGRTRSPLRRNVEAAEVGDATTFLLSDLARGMTGCVLFVDGGFHITAL
ncbi:MAG: enoyl-ACP reductase FabI [Planctomycetota bacterium]|jgi:enoyl-[acyl-carrier protein] reductase I